MDSDSHFKRTLIILLFILLAGISFGLFWFFFLGPSIPVGLGWYLFSFTAGLSMIVLPCTLPLAFVIVPLSMGKGAFKGFLIALFFGLGVAITLSLYGVFAAVLGKVAIGTLGAPLEVVKNWLYFIAGAFAYLFALGELGLVNFRMPTYSGALPGFIQKQQDIVKALLLGLFLGNIGVGCPHPATPVILTRIAVSGDVFYGWLLFFIHAVGRVLPLIFLAILGILGVNALAGLVKHKDKIERATGWAMVFVAGFILVLGLFSHDWWVLSGQHTYLESITQEETFLNFLGAKLGTGNAHHHGLPPADHTGLFGLPLSLGTWMLLFLWILPLWWYYKNEKKKKSFMTSPEKETRTATLRYLFWNFVSLSLILVLIFGYILPHRFVEEARAEEAQHQVMNAGQGGMMPMGSGGAMAGHGPTMYHEEGTVGEGLDIRLLVAPSPPLPLATSTLDFAVTQQPQGTPISWNDLEVQHEKKMHVIGVRRDLKEFFHIRPEPDAKVPGHAVVRYRFTTPGEFKIWSSVQYGGTTHVFGHPFVNVSGTPPLYDLGENPATSKIVGNFQASIFSDDLHAGSDGHLGFSIKTADGRDAELENYLGEKMHLVLISEDLTQFVHTHPSTHSSSGTMQMHSFLSIPVASAHEEGTDTNTNPGMNQMMDHLAGANQDLVFHVAFPKPGLYKAFAQFRPAGAQLPQDEALTADFWIRVGDAAPALLPQAPNPFPKAYLVIVSLIIMALLGYGVKRYITVK